MMKFFQIWNKQQKQQRRSRIIRFGFCLTGFSILFCFEGWAGGPGQQEQAQELENANYMVYTAVDGYEISEERLSDSVIEYEELGSLIHAYNRTVQEIVKSDETVWSEYMEIQDYLRSEKASASRKKSNAKDSGDLEQYAENASLEAIYKAGIKNYNDAIKRLNRYSANRDRILLERQLTNAGQNLMISWQSLSLQEQVLTKKAELFYAQYELSQNQMQTGLITDDEAQVAYQSWTEAKNSLLSLEDSRKNIYQNLCVLLGVKEDGSMSLKELSSTDLQQQIEVLEEKIDLERDLKEALNNNTDMIDERHFTPKGMAESDDKTRKLDELEETTKIQVKQLYETILQAQKTYDTARVGLEGAELTWSGSQIQYSTGMLSKAEFLKREVAYLDKKIALETAQLDLFQALQIYEWAIKGIISDS